MNRMARAAVPLLALLVAACTAPGPARPRSHWADEPARGGRPLGHTVTDSRGGLDAASFALDSGVTTVQLRVADLGGDLYRVRTPDDAEIAPWVQRDDADLRLFTQGTGLPGPASVDVTLHSAVRWHLRLGGGAEDERIDLRGGDVSAVEVVAGAGRVSLNLPAPRGTVPVRMTGGAGEFLVSVVTPLSSAKVAASRPPREPVTVWPSGCRPRAGSSAQCDRGRAGPGAVQAATSRASRGTAARAIRFIAASLPVAPGRRTA